MSSVESTDNFFNKFTGVISGASLTALLISKLTMISHEKVVGLTKRNPQRPMLKLPFVIGMSSIGLISAYNINNFVNK